MLLGDWGATARTNDLLLLDLGDDGLGVSFDGKASDLVRAVVGQLLHLLQGAGR